MWQYDDLEARKARRAQSWEKEQWSSICLRGFSRVRFRRGSTAKLGEADSREPRSDGVVTRRNLTLLNPRRQIGHLHQVHHMWQYDDLEARKARDLAGSGFGVGQRPNSGRRTHENHAPTG
jgi:hypothetical protein